MYELDGKYYPIIKIKKNNKHTYIKVKDGSIYITTNYFTSDKVINKLLIDNKESIDKMIYKHVKREKKDLDFYYLGNKYDIIILPSKNNVEIIDNKIYTKNNQMLNTWLKNQIQQIFKNRLDYNIKLFEEDIIYPSLKIRTMTTRWGVCNNKNKTITLNSKLIRFEIDYLDYVIIHELSHLVHPNHSNNFWNLVSKYCPNYKKIRQKLKE